jgi:hypothetical protein
MAIIDILGLPHASAPAFTVDNTQVRVLPVQSSSDGYAMYNASNCGWFQAGDHITIESIGVRMPLQFQTITNPSIGNVIPYLVFTMYNAAVPFNNNIPELGIVSNVHIPMDNFELALGIFCSAFTAKDTHNVLKPFKLACFFSGFYVSMKNVPDTLQSSVQYIFPWVKVSHNKQLLETI